jgi:hypothetical protein
MMYSNCVSVGPSMRSCAHTVLLLVQEMLFPNCAPSGTSMRCFTQTVFLLVHPWDAVPKLCSYWYIHETLCPNCVPLVHPWDAVPKLCSYWYIHEMLCPNCVPIGTSMKCCALNCVHIHPSSTSSKCCKAVGLNCLPIGIPARCQSIRSFHWSSSYLACCPLCPAFVQVKKSTKIVDSAFFNLYAKSGI